jgi:TPR repeat protein
VFLKVKPGDPEKKRRSQITSYVYRLLGTCEGNIPLCTPQEFRSLIGLDSRQSTLVALRDDSTLPLSDEERVFAVDIFTSEWKKIPSTNFKVTKANALERERQLQPLELLELKQKGSLATKTTLARAYLNGWFTTNTPDTADTEKLKAFDRAVELLTYAAQQGEAEACFLIATLHRPPIRATSNDLHDPAHQNFGQIQTKFRREFVIQDEMERLNYLEYAVSRGFEPAREELWQYQMMVEESADYDQYANQNSIDFYPENYEYYSIRASDLLKEADQGDPVAQRTIAVGILESDESIVHFLASTQKEGPRAKYWLELAAGSGDAEAKYHLATKFNEEENRRVDLLKEVIFSEALPELKAESCLALGKILVSESLFGDVDLAEKLFRVALDLDKYNKGANFALATLTLRKEHPTQDELLAALEFFDSEEKDPELLLLSGLMRIRGQGCPISIDAARVFFERALSIRPSIHRRRRSRFDLQAERIFYPKNDIESWTRLVLALGWGKLHEWERIARQILWSDISQSSTDRTYPPISENDVAILLAHNPEYDKYCEVLKLRLEWRDKKPQLANENLLAAGWHFGFANMKLFFQGLLYCLRQASFVDEEFLGQYWNDDCSLAEYFGKGCLFVFGRFGADRVFDGIPYLNRAIEIAEIASDAPDQGPLSNPKFALQVLSDARDKLNDVERAVHIRKIEDSNCELKRKSLELEHANCELKQKSLELEDMMAMFAHKFRGPVDSIISNAEHHLENRDHLFKDLGRTMNGLLDIFSFVSSHSEKLLPRLQEDSGGPHSLTHVLHKALWLTIVQLLTKRNIDRMNKLYFVYALREGRIPANTAFSDWRREKPMRDVREAIRTTWEMDIGAYGDFADLDGLLAWLASKLMLIRVEGISTSNIRFSDSGTKESLLLVILTEVLVNAIKHYEPSSELPIQIRWRMDADKAVFSCENPTSDVARKRGEGSGRGLKFLSMIARNVAGEFRPPGDTDDALVEFSFPIKLFE